MVIEILERNCETEVDINRGDENIWHSRQGIANANPDFCGVDNSKRWRFRQAAQFASNQNPTRIQ